MGKSLSWIVAVGVVAIVWIMRVLPSIRTLIVRVALVHMCKLGIHWLVRFLYGH